MRNLLLSIFVLGVFDACFGQNAHNFWQNVGKEEVSIPESAVVEFEPTSYHALRLDFQRMKNTLKSAPVEFSSEQKTLLVSFPQSDGSMESFSLRESSVMMPGLQAKYPEMRTYVGESIANKGKKIRCSITERGFKATIRRPDYGIEYIEPFATGQKEWYRVYDRLAFPVSLRPQGLKATIDPTEVNKMMEAQPELFFLNNQQGSAERNFDPINIKVYRFACATTGEFSQDHGGTKALVLAALVDYTNTLNVIYESDLNIRLKLIDEIESVIFLDPATDPYSGVTVQDWMGQNPLAMLQALGSPDKYDIGHVYARYLGGGAIGVAGGLCCTQNKARGCSAGFPPYGDGFLAIPGQEIGHQWASGHTWNRCDANDQFTPDSACEPGSGSTIMSYAGACGTDNVSIVTDLYYQACSIKEIKTFVAEGIGATCGTSELTANNPPVVTIDHPNNFFIPISTPFELNGAATDPDGDTGLTYCWDEIDLGPSRPLGSPQANSPLFRSLSPKTVTNRIFPKIQTVVSNQIDKAEFLPTYTRDLTFRLVVRDNVAVGSGIGTAELAFKSTNLAGPFLVSSPNLATDIWKVGEYAQVNWDVANTDKAPVNCQQVNISLSTDGGLTYPITLASGLPNNGSACVLVPNNVTTKARIRIKAADNVFFDISNANFKIEATTTAGFSICADNLIKQVCTPETYVSQISTNAFSGFTGAVALTATGLPANAVATFNPATITPGGSSEMTVVFSGTVPEGTFDVIVKGDGGGASASRTIKLTVINNGFSAMTLQTPTDGAIGTNQSPSFTWNTVPDANLYDIEIATNPSFDNATLVNSGSNLTVGTYNLPVVLEKGKVYFWRVRPINECGAGPWAETYSFATLQESCQVFAATDLPKNLSTNGTPTIESSINILSAGVVSDVNVKSIQGQHASFKQLEAHLISPQGTDVLLFKNKCGSIASLFKFGVDESAASFPCPPPANNTAVKTAEPLTVFNGQNLAGAWILRVKDNEAGAGGSIDAFSLELCSASALNAPYIVNNIPLQLQPGNNAAVSNDLLKAEDANNTAAQLTFTLVSVPKFGRLQNGGTELLPGAQFTQADLDNGLVRYFDFGPHAGADDFRFVVTDGEGGMVNGKFLIQPFFVGTFAPTALLDFSLTPNPANESVVLNFNEQYASSTRVAIINTAGQLVQNIFANTGGQSITLDISLLPGGLYFVTVENEKGKGVRKLVVK